MAVGDFNADGIPDLAVTGGSGLSILLGKADGSFPPPQTYAVGAPIASLAIGDFNGDGHLDLVVANNTSEGSVNILLGNGDGTFQIGADYAVGSFLTSVAAGDFNGDGFLDLAVASSNTNSVLILLGNGDGSFQGAQSYAAGGEPNSLAIGDFDGDGRLDLAVADSTLATTVVILLGNGDGTLQAAQSYDIGFYPYAVTVGDFNNDGIPDLALANFDGHAVAVMLGNGDGSFQAAQSYEAGSYPVSLAVGDFNGDGFLDLAVANQGSSTVSVLLGNGDGTLQASNVSYVVDSYPPSVAVGDFDRDGHPDLAVADTSGVSILKGRGDGTFQGGPLSFSYGQAGTFDANGSGTSVAAGDFNSDGHLDLAVPATDSNGNGLVNIFLGNGNGTFQAAQSYPARYGTLAVADFNGDGKLDLATSGGSLLLGNYDGTFQPARDYGVSGVTAVVGDFNGDGIPDLAVLSQGTGANSNSGSIHVLLGKGDGTFQPAKNIAVGANPASVALGDFNGDGRLDLAVIQNAGNSTAKGMVIVFLGNGDGTFQEGGSFTAGVGLHSLAVGDFNRDGKDDIVTVDFAVEFNFRPPIYQVIASDVQVFLGNGDGTFQPAQTYTTSSGYPVAVAVGDFNRDGIPDLLLADGGEFYFPGTTVSVLLGNGDGTFQAAQSYGAGGYPTSVALGDFNGDGYVDVVAGNVVNPGMVTVLLNAAD